MANKMKNVAVAVAAAESPLERNGLASFDQKLALAKRCSHGIYIYIIHFSFIILLFLISLKFYL